MAAMGRESRTGSTGIWVATAVLVAACGGSPPKGDGVEPSPVSTLPSSGGGGPDDLASPGDLGEGCPATADAGEGRLCAADGVHPAGSCSYPDGAHCHCTEEPYCSGAERVPAPVEQYVWVCNQPPPEVREDGCPGRMPEAGSPCSPVAKVCGYGDCCVQSIRCTEEGWGEPTAPECPA